MVVFIRKGIVIGLSAGILHSSAAHAVFTGDVELACEAALCIYSKSTIKECTPSLKKYYAIKFKKRFKTAQARQNFLNKCPQ